jgi:hypothetical protein
MNMDPTTLVYSEKMRSTFMIVLGAGLTAVAIGLAVFQEFATAAIVALAAALSCWYSIAKYEVSSVALTVKVGGGMPHLKIRGEDIRSVQRSDVGAIRSGGLGYRGSWTIGKRVIVSLGGLGGVTVLVRPKGKLSLSSDHADRLEDALLRLVAATQPDGGSSVPR